jgi:hypothetical protein
MRKQPIAPDSRWTWTITVGDSRSPLEIQLRDGGSEPIDLASLTVKAQAETPTGTSTVAETTTGVTAQPTSTFTVDTSADELLVNAHGLVDGDQVQVSTSGTLPSGLAASTRYFVRGATPNRFQLAAKPAGAPLDITSSGSGTHSVWLVGHVRYVVPSAINGTAGEYLIWFTVYDVSNNRDTFPSARDGLRVIVAPRGA